MCAGRLLSHGELEQAGLSLHRGWQIARDAVLGRALTPRGLRFRHRSARVIVGADAPAQAVQIDSPGLDDPTSWLAHPELMSILHLHFAGILGESTCYFAPRQGILVAAVRSSADHPALRAWADETSAGGGICAGALEYHRGFPRQLRQAVTRV